MSTEDRKTGVNSIAELIEADEHAAKRRLVQLAAGGLIGIGLLFTGYLNFMLYSRAFPDNMKIFGLIPALLLEGSLALFLLGSFVWFAHGVQGTLAKIFGWLMFVIVGLNTVIEFNALTGSGTGGNEFLQLYAFWGTPLVLVLAIAFWKAVIDADPSVQIMRQRRKIQQTLQVAKMNAEINALGSEESRWALQVFGERSAADVNRRLIGDGVKQLPEAQPSRLESFRAAFSKPDAPLQTLASDSPAALLNEMADTRRRMAHSNTPLAVETQPASHPQPIAQPRASAPVIQPQPTPEAGRASRPILGQYLTAGGQWDYARTGDTIETSAFVTVDGEYLGPGTFIIGKDTVTQKAQPALKRGRPAKKR